MKEYIERDSAAAFAYDCGAVYVSNRLSDKTAFPAADVAPVRYGNWCWEGRFRACSICGSYVEFTETLGASHWKYCPYCGAKMNSEV